MLKRSVGSAGISDSTEPSGPTEAEAQAALLCADPGLALAGHEVTDPVLRGLMDSVVRNEITGDEAVAAMRLHIQGDYKGGV